MSELAHAFSWPKWLLLFLPALAYGFFVGWVVVPEVVREVVPAVVKTALGTR